MKILLSERRGNYYGLITIYSDYELDVPPFENDCICVKETLGFENDLAVLKRLIDNLISLVELQRTISDDEWNVIIKTAYNNSRRMTTDEFKNNVEKINSNIIVEGEYTGSWNKIACKCKKCGNLWYPQAKALLQGCGCKKCADKEKGESKRKTHDAFIKELKNINPNIEVLEQYVLSQQKIRCRCLICGNEWEAIPNNLLKGRGCKKCQNNKMSIERRKTPEQFLSEMSTINPNIEFLGKYETGQTKIDCLCKKCNHTWAALPQELLAGRGCPKCAQQLRTESKYKKVILIETQQVFPSLKAVAEYLMVDPKKVSNCLRGMVKTVNNYHLKYYIPDEQERD